MKKVLSVGSIAMDIVFEASHLPVDDDFSWIRKETMMPGGSSSNIAVSARGYGLDVCQVGRVGDDEMGKRFIQSLEESGVNHDCVFTLPGGITMHTYIVTAPGGQHAILANFGTCMQDFVPSDLPEGILDEIDIVYSDLLFAHAVAEYLVETGAEKGKTVVFNMQCVPSFMKMCGTSDEALEMALGKCNLLLGGKASYDELAPEEIRGDYEAICKWAYDRYGMSDGVIITLGGDGAVWYDGADYHKAPAFKIDPVDTTGAGDCFIGALLYAFYEKQLSKEDALAFANASAAIKCTVAGPRNMASEDDVLCFMKSQVDF